jgi:hypothetical protein
MLPQHAPQVYAILEHRAIVVAMLGGSAAADRAASRAVRAGAWGVAAWAGVEGLPIQTWQCVLKVSPYRVYYGQTEGVCLGAVVP